MRAIKLNDEIEVKNIKEKKYSKTNKNLMELDAISSPKNRKHKSSKAAGKGTISPRKSRKKEKRINCEENNNESKLNVKFGKPPEGEDDEDRHDKKNHQKNLKISILGLFLILTFL